MHACALLSNLYMGAHAYDSAAGWSALHRCKEHQIIVMGQTQLIFTLQINWRKTHIPLWTSSMCLLPAGLEPATLGS